MPRIGTGLGLGFFKASAGSAYDADAQAFFDRVTTAGGSLSTTEKNAVNQLVLDMKSYGIWTSMKAIYPMVGASAAACAQNLKSSSFTGSFSSGWTFASTGVTPNGVSAYMNTGLIPNAEFTTSNDGNFGYYSRTDLVSSKVVLGADSGGFYFIDFPYTGSTFYPSINDGNALSISPGYDKGFRQVSRNPSTLSQIQYRKNTTSYTLTEPSINKPTAQVNLGRSSSTYYSSNEIAFAYVGDGQLTTTNQSDYYTAVQTFNQTLNRQVGAQIVSDADAQAYINRVYTAGGTLTNTEANAVNQLVIDMKAAGIWTAMKAVYPMVGSSAASCAQNLKSSSFTGTFTSGWTFSSTGVTGNGTSAYFDSNCLVNTNLSPTNYGGGFYKRNNTPTSEADFGALSASFNIYSNYDGNTTYHRGISASPDNYTNTSSNGFFHQYGKTSQSTAFNRSVKKLTGNQGTLNGTNSVCLAGNVVSGYTNSQYAFMFLSEALTDTQAADFYTCVQTFNTTLARQV